MTLDPKTIYLILTIVMPGQAPDIKHYEPQVSVAVCEKNLHEYLMKENPKHPPGAQAVMGACLRPITPDTNAKSTHSTKHSG